MRGRSETDLEDLYPVYNDALLRASSSEQVMVGGVPGTLKLQWDWAFLVWQRPGGTWLGVAIRFPTTAERRPDRGRAAAAVLQVAQWVRTEVGYRCVLDFRLKWTPPGSHPVGCLLSVAPGFRRYGQLIAADNEITFMVYTEPAEGVAKGESLARYPYGERVFEVTAAAAPTLTLEDAFKVVSGFTSLEDPLPV